MPFDRRGRTALHVIAQMPRAFAQLAHDCGEPHYTGRRARQGLARLHCASLYAVENGNLKLARLLLEACADRHVVSSHGRGEQSFTKLEDDLRDPEKEWVERSHRALIKGRTPLHLAAERGHWHVAAELLKDQTVGEEEEGLSTVVNPIDDSGCTTPFVPGVGASSMDVTV